MEKYNEVNIDDKYIDAMIIELLRENSSGSRKWTQIESENVVNVLPYLFKLWSCKRGKSKHFNQEGDEEVRERVPTLIEVTACLILLGVGAQQSTPDEEEEDLFARIQQQQTNKNELANFLLRVFPGEGRSLILGITAMTLALNGLKVDIACSSEMSCEQMS